MPGARILLASLVAQTALGDEVGVGAGTQFPIQVGAEVEWMHTRWIWPTARIGYLPGPYASTIASLAGTAGASEDVQHLIEHSIDDSLALSLVLRSRPFERLGLFAQAGLMVYTLGGGVDVRAALRAAGVDVPACPATRRRRDCDVPASSTLWMVPVGLGWRFWPHPRWSVDVDAAYLFLVHSRTETDYDAPGLDDQLDALMREEVYDPYFYAGWVGVAGSYHFGR